VGLIPGAEPAAQFAATGDADVVLIARESLRDPYFPRRAAQQLGAKIDAPLQYQRAW
jgi:2,4-dienoyl-CoA reductase-like NADH-dependent reductase (Old Yellow Enzyme family)